MKARLKKIFSVSPLKITLFVILLVLALFFLDAPFLRFMELKTLDLRMLSRGTIPSGGETVIAVIDEESLAELGRWPWPRTTIAKLVDALKACGAKAIAFEAAIENISGSRYSMTKAAKVVNESAIPHAYAAAPAPLFTGYIPW